MGARYKTHGATLIELVVGMCLLGMAFLLLSNLFFSQNTRAADAIFQLRATELADVVMNESWSLRFDENTDPNGNTPCGAGDRPACSSDLGPEESSRSQWDDVDDMHGMTENTNLPIPIGSATTYKALYPNFKLNVSVTYLDNTAKFEEKLVTVIVTTPNSQEIEFSTIRRNY